MNDFLFNNKPLVKTMIVLFSLVELHYYNIQCNISWFSSSNIRRDRTFRNTIRKDSSG